MKKLLVLYWHIYQSFLIAYACGFSLPALKLIHDYLSNRRQGTKINTGFGIVSYSNDTPSFASASNMDRVVKSFGQASTIFFKWFSDNLMKSNASKSHVWVTTKNTVYIKIENCGIKNSYDEKILSKKNLSKKNYE